MVSQRSPLLTIGPWRSRGPGPGVRWDPAAGKLSVPPFGFSHSSNNTVRTTPSDTLPVLQALLQYSLERCCTPGCLHAQKLVNF